MGHKLFIEANEFIAQLEKRGLVIAPKELLARQLVNGMPIEQYRAKVLNQPLISLKEIADSRIWGEISKGQVRNIVKAQVPPGEVVRPNGVVKIPRHLVRNISIARGVSV